MPWFCCGAFCVLSGLRACCGARVRWVSGLSGGASFAHRSGPISGHGWGRWCACLFLGACPVGAWEQWRWRVLRAGSVGLLLRRCILVEVRTLLCGAYSGCGWAPPYLCVWSGHLAAWRVFCARLWVYPVCYEVENSPLFNFNRIFPPFPGACRNLCAETSYLRVQCLCLATLGYAILCAGRRGYNT